MISISCIYSMSINSKTRRCDVYKNDDLIGWMAYFKDEDRIAYFNDLENQIFDVWYDGHFVDHGEELYNAYITYCMELELLKLTETI